MALLLDARADAVDARSAGGSSVELVWTGPETAVAFSRDTSVVVRELFQAAQRSVIVSTFVIQAGKAVFDALARRMDEVADLNARFFLHVGRKRQDARHESELLREFAVRFRKDWPGARYPQVFYDPRAILLDNDRSIWHAKCVLVDDQVGFVTSANFTEPAQTRNIEAGVIIRDSRFVGQLRAQLDGLVASRQVKRLPGF
jgi:phosphatidylserine/phosphatidylglycerophosphate/cardiolipin synthase-like enzyme